MMMMIIMTHRDQHGGPETAACDGDSLQKKKTFIFHITSPHAEIYIYEDYKLY